MDFYDLVNAGINVTEGISYTGRDDKYISAIQRFYRSYQKNRTEIENYLASNDVANYTILVHAIKSNARTIGADSLADIAFELENKGKENNWEYISKNNYKLFSEYEKTIAIFKNYGEMETVKPYDEIDGEEAKETAEKLIEALEDFDDENSLRLADKLSGYPFRITQKNLLKDAIRYIEDFCYDEATEIITKLTDYIEID